MRSSIEQMLLLIAMIAFSIFRTIYKTKKKNAAASANMKQERTILATPSSYSKTVDMNKSYASGKIFGDGTTSGSLQTAGSNAAPGYAKTSGRIGTGGRGQISLAPPEPGYMYLNGVYTKLADADKIHF
jgi:hypothetical protein